MKYRSEEDHGPISSDAKLIVDWLMNVNRRLVRIQYLLVLILIALAVIAVPDLVG